MRNIPIDGPRARYQRLRHLGDLAEYGLSLDRHHTAPFRVVWDAYEREAQVRLRDTVLARVYPHADPVVLRVEDAYPADADAFLLRAVRNAADLTDTWAKRKAAAERAEKARAAVGEFQSTRLLVDGLLKRGMTAEEMVRAVCGLAAEQAWVLPDPEMRPEVLANLGVLSVLTEGGRDLPENEDALFALLRRGLDIWRERMDADALTAQCQAVADATRVAERSLESAFFAAQRHRARLLPADAVFGDLSADHAPVVRFRGVPIGTRGWGTTVLTPVVALGVPHVLARAAVKAMDARVILAQIGKTMADFPAIDPAALRALVAEVDLGYRG